MPEKTQLVKLELLEALLYIPPPFRIAELPKNAQLLNVGLETRLKTPAPFCVAVFPENVQPFRVKLGELLVYRAPPLTDVVFPENIQLVTVRPVNMAVNPPPLDRRMPMVSTVTDPVILALPPVMVKPFSSVVVASLTESTTWRQLSELLPTMPMSPLRVVTLIVQLR